MLLQPKLIGVCAEKLIARSVANRQQSGISVPNQRKVSDRLFMVDKRIRAYHRVTDIWLGAKRVPR